jgi:DNA-binding transcriptional ArsR family regulator
MGAGEGSACWFRSAPASKSTFNHPVDLFAPKASFAGMTTPLDIVFSALTDPTRRAILAMLLEDDMAVTDVAEPFAMSLAAISKHLQVLTEAGLISQEKRGRVKWCKLEPDALREASVWMQGFGQMGGLDLDAFERFLDWELHGTPPEPVTDA